VEIRRIVPNVRCERSPESRSFYREVLGLDVAMDAGWIVHLVSPTNPTAQLGLIARDATAPVHPDITVEVADVDRVHAGAVAAGHEVVYPLTDEPWGVRRFFVRDPNGVVVNVMMHRET
jgi:catechol 2,3-dioxygenase-like lactoylglutathione lyase family enzyme